MELGSTGWGYRFGHDDGFVIGDVPVGVAYFGVASFGVVVDEVVRVFGCVEGECFEIESLGVFFDVCKEAGTESLTLVVGMYCELGE